MRHRLAVLIGATVLCAMLWWPLAQAAGAQSQTPGLTLPAVTGSLARGGQFTGALTITRLTNRAGPLVADGLVVGNVSTEPVWATPVSTAPVTGAAIFSATSTPTPTFETVGTPATPPPTATNLASTPVTNSMNSTITIPATATPTHTLGIVVTATPTPTATREDLLPRAPLLDESVTRAAQSTAVSQSFRDIPLTLADPDLGACDTLNLDLGVVFVDQLGVQLDLTPAVIDIATLPRPNRPLGGLLCTVASLVDLGPSSNQAATLNELLPIVNRALSTTAR